MIREQTYADFRKRYLAGERIIGMTSSMMSPASTEVIGHAGFDFVIVDTEMLAINPETIENMVRAAECAQTVPIIKLKDNHPIMISDALNTGAPMVKIPHASSPEALKRGMDGAFFKPKGNRGLCSVSRANKFAQGKMTELMEWTNSQVQVIPIIEEKEAVDRVDELMAVEGIEVYDIGPVDLSESYGVEPGKGFANPIVDAALQKIVEAADKHGKHVMTVPVLGTELTPELTKEKLIDRGVNMIFYRTDSVNLRVSAREAMRLRTL